MVSFSTLLVSGLAATALAAPLKSRAVQKRSEGTVDGYFYSWYDSGSDATFDTSAGNGEYSVSWDGSDDFVGGLGWSTGSTRSITYSASYSPDGNSYLAVYGWMEDPLVEYYVLEDWYGYDPSSGATYVGQFTSDDGTYNVYTDTRTNEPSIEGTSTFEQYWSVRQSTRTSGTVTFANHVAAWESLGLSIGSSYNYQIMAVEGFSGTGSATVTVS